VPRTAIAIPEPDLRDLCRRYSVKELAGFGSARRDDFRPDSDVDFLVEFQPDADASLLDLFRMQRELEDLTQRRVALSSKRGLHPVIRDAVLRERLVLWSAAA